MTKMINLQIDGKKVTVKEGTTILQAAKSIGIKIPHLCYREDLPIIGGCRMCVVEVENARSLIASCAYPVSEGMVVKTNTERVIKSRKMVLELLLSDHPYDCMTCEKSGDCKLEKYAYEYGVRKTRFVGEKHTYNIDDSNPFIERDYNKCILCGRCVAVCQNVQISEAIDYINRGFKSKIGTPFDRGLQDSTCVFCGQCVGVCPTGALIEKIRKGKARTWEMKKIDTTCAYCGCGCGITLYVKDNKIIKVEGDRKRVTNKGNLCVKGRFGFDFVNHTDRLKKPLIKKDGKFEESTWDEALNYVASKFKEIKLKYGADSLAGLASAKCTNEENYIFQKFIRAVFGTNNVDHCARLCHASTVVGLAMAFGSGAMTNSISEIRNTDCILVTGSNTTEAHPIIALEIKAAVKHNKAKLIVIDPRKIELTRYATHWLKIKPGSNVAVFNAILNVIIEENLINTEFIKSRTVNFDEVKEVVKKYTPESVEEITGVSAEEIKTVARVYANSKNSSIIYSMGVTQHTTGTDGVLTLANLAMATGNICRESTGINPLRGQNNVQGACDMGSLPNVYPGYQKVIDNKVREKFEKAWKVSLSDKNGLTIIEMMNAAIEGKIKGMYIMGENPMLSDPNLNHVKQALTSLDFLVVQDIFMTETAELADVVLPVASFAEKDGTFTNTERRVQMVRKALTPPGESRIDWEIIMDLSNRMGYKMHYNNVSEIMDEINSLTPIYGGICYDRLTTNGLQWPCPSKDHPGTPYLHKDQFTCGLGKFHPVEYRKPAELPDEKYPYILTTGRNLTHYHTGTMTRRSIGLNEYLPEGKLEINPVDAKNLNIKDEDLIRISSRRGEIVLKALITEKSPKGVVFLPFHFKEASANVLTIDALDPLAKIPEFKVCAVKLEHYN